MVYDDEAPGSIEKPKKTHDNCRHGYWERDENYHLHMCELRPERIWGVEQRDCNECKEFSAYSLEWKEPFMKQKHSVYPIAGETLQVGDRVQHSHYGDGTVERVYDIDVTIRFDNGEIRRILVPTYWMAKLEN